MKKIYLIILVTLIDLSCLFASLIGCSFNKNNNFFICFVIVLSISGFIALLLFLLFLRIYYLNYKNKKNKEVLRLMEYMILTNENMTNLIQQDKFQDVCIDEDFYFGNLKANIKITIPKK